MWTGADFGLASGATTVLTLLGIIATLVPQRYRPRVLGDAQVQIKRAAILSGAGQFVLCAAALWFRYPAFYARRVQEAADAVARIGGDKTAIATAHFSGGVLALFEYLIQPLTVVLVYFLLEGIARLAAAVTTNEVLPTLPLQVIAWIHAGVSAQRKERALGPKVADLVQAGTGKDFELRIESCRPKQWTALSTIRYQEELYEVARQEDGQPPRRFVYLLRKIPAGKVIRGLHPYDPNEVLAEQ